jgi:hypothetical protein
MDAVEFARNVLDSKGVVRTAGSVMFLLLSKDRQPPLDQVFIASCTVVKVPLLEAIIPKVRALSLVGPHSCIATLLELTTRLCRSSSKDLRAKELTALFCRSLPM